MLERKLITGAEKLYGFTLKLSVRLLNRRTKRVEARYKREREYANKVSDAAMLTIARAGQFYQTATAKFANDAREITALDNEIQNRMDDLHELPIVDRG